MKSIHFRTLLDVLDSHQTPCVSVYIPLLQWREHLQFQVESIRSQLVQRFESRWVEQFLAPLTDPSLTQVRLRPTTQTLAFLRSENQILVVPMGMAMRTFSVLADSFHVKPLVRWFGLSTRYRALHFYQQRVELMEGSLSEFKSLGSFDVASSGALSVARDFVSKYLGSVVLSGGSPPSDWNGFLKPFPFLLISMDQSNFGALEVSYHRFLLEQAEIRDQFVIHDFLLELEKGLTIETRLQMILKQLKRGAIKQLLVSEEDFIPGSLGVDRDRIRLRFQSNRYWQDDVLDDLLELAGSRGVDVRVLPRKLIPGQAPICGLIESESLAG